MRILIFGGFISYQFQLANALTKKGERVMVVIPSNRLSKEHMGTMDKKVNLFLLGRGRPWYHPISLLILKDFLKKINAFKPDVVHIQAGGGLLYLFILPFIKKYPLVTTVHDPKLHVGQKSYRRLKFVINQVIRTSDQIIVHGKKLKTITLKEYMLPEDNVHVVTIGEHEVAPFKKYERDDLKEDGNLILFFGRIWKYKGLEYLIKAEPILTKEVPDTKIVIAGTGENFKKYEKMMVNKDNFIVHNYRIPYKEGAELFQRCSVVVLPYIDASQSGVITTAYGFKKPVVVTDVGAIPEIVDDGVTGFIVPPKKPEALADAIVKLLKDEKLRKKMGENAYKKLKTDLSWDKIAEKTIEVYKEAIKEHNK